MPYLTKSRFKLALECTSKLYYNDNKQYANKATEDNFLKNLATGGFQVGALAQCYFPTGILIDTLEHEDAYKQTTTLLQQQDVIIFEAALLYENCFIRADILLKKGNEIQLVEVKAKSYSSKDKFTNKKGGIEAKWEPYLYDIAFQTWVTRACLKHLGLDKVSVTPFLMLADKDANTSIEGLNQRFFYNEGERKLQTDASLCTPDALGTPVLIQVPVAKEVAAILTANIGDISFEDYVQQCSNAVEKGTMMRAEIGLKCKKCGFVANEEMVAAGKLNGFHECWKEKAGFKDSDFNEPMSWEIWGSSNAARWISEGKYFLRQLTSSDLEPKTASKKNNRGLSRLERQNLQRAKGIKLDFTYHCHKEGLQQYFKEWTYPFHCIDFETTTVALPFHKGMHPYEQIAFQFSHHILKEDGSVTHQSEWINTTTGHFPNFDFVRALKKALYTEGTIFRYAAHENSVLCQIHKQLSASNEPDKKELLLFIEHITTKKKKKGEAHWDGIRTMVDLRDVVVDSYYSLHAKGSNSIKDILPAILASSPYIQAKYGTPVYGTDTIQSKNFKDFTWLKIIDGKVQNPYKLLEPVFSKEEDEMLEEYLLDENAGINDGGAAMAAYGKMQFTRMSDGERARIIKALLRYCELDTLAMVMILEEFRELAKY
jgi:hypothetical protein